MKRSPKKLKLAKETLLNLESDSLQKAYGGAATERSVCVTICATNCTACGSACPGCV